MGDIKNKSTRNANVSIINILMLIFIVLFSVIVGIIILLDNTRPYNYTWLPMLPIFFGLINILCYKVYLVTSVKLVNIFIVLLYTIRNVVVPLTMVFGNYQSFFVLLNFENINMAISLMLYESLVVFVFLAWRSSSEKVLSVRKIDISIKIHSKKRIKVFGLALFLTSLFCLIAYITIPEIRASYVTIFEGDKLVSSLGTPEQFSTGTVNRIFFTLFNLFFGILQVFLPLFIIYILRYKFGDKFLIGIISCAVVFVNLLFMTNETAYTLVVILVLLIVILNLFQKQKIKLIITSGVIFILLAINVFLLKTNDMYVNSNSYTEDMAIMFQAYFPNVSNLAGVFNIYNSSKLTTLFYDFYTMIPFRSTLFGMEGDMRLVLLYTAQNNAQGNIIPFVGQAYHYLGFVLAPLVSIFVLNIALVSERKLANSRNVWFYSTYLLVLIYSCFALIMYNLTIFGARFFVTMLPMLLLASYSGKSFRFINER